MANAAWYDPCMGWEEYDSTTCSVFRALDVLSDRWTVLVLRDVLNGVRRFDDIQRHLGIARDVLTKRLASLAEQGIVERVPYREPGARTRYEYRPTAAGRDLRTVLIALIGWGDKHRPGADGPPTIVVHSECGAPVHADLRCERGHLIENRTRMHVEPGPGARKLA